MLGQLLGIIAVAFSILFFSPYGSLFFTLAAIFSIWFSKGIPPALIAVPCGISGIIILYARYAARKSGIAQQSLRMLKDSPKAYKQAQSLEALYLSTGLFNTIIFTLFVFKKMF